MTDNGTPDPRGTIDAVWAFIKSKGDDGATTTEIANAFDLQPGGAVTIVAFLLMQGRIEPRPGMQRLNQSNLMQHVYFAKED